MNTTTREPESKRMNLLYGAGIVVLLIIIIVLIQGIRHELKAEPKPMAMDSVVTMLVDDGMLIHTTAPREAPLGVRESVDIIFDDVVLESTPPNFGRIEGMIHTFETQGNRDSWIETSQAFDGVAVVRGDELWAISVDSDLPQSRDIAERLANTIDGEVK